MIDSSTTDAINYSATHKFYPPDAGGTSINVAASLSDTTLFCGWEDLAKTQQSVWAIGSTLVFLLRFRTVLSKRPSSNLHDKACGGRVNRHLIPVGSSTLVGQLKKSEDRRRIEAQTGVTYKYDQYCSYEKNSSLGTATLTTRLEVEIRDTGGNRIDPDDNTAFIDCAYTTSRG